MTRREEAALRVRALHPPLTVLFAALREEAGAAPPADAVAEAPAPPPADSLATALLRAVDDGAEDGEALALRLALAADDVLTAASRTGARTARDAGVPGDDDVDASDALLVVLAPYAAAVASGDDAPPSPELLERLRAVARNAGVVAAARAGGWTAVQRFGDPWCPRSGCYGRDGAPLTDDLVREEGVPPYGDGCNCSAEPAAPAPPGDATA